MKNKNWFEVDVKGLKALQAGKPKHYLLRELVANAFDENIKVCSVHTNLCNGTCYITVSDDSPEGFRNLRDAYTLFGDTRKRRDVTKRGKFNCGEKQTIALCDFASIKTTKGTVVFSDKGRGEIKDKTKSGSIVTVRLKMKVKEYDEMLKFLDNYLPPKGILFEVNDKQINYVKPFFVTEDTLPTQIEIEGQLRDTQRKTEVHIHKRDVNFLYEMGIPIVEIDCPYSIDVQQKVPMSVDRESVKPSYLKQIFAIALNKVVDDVKEEESSESWIRIGSGDKRMTQETMSKLVKKRFGDKIVVANPQDPVSNDDAISNGFRVIQGRELSVDEWRNVKEHELIKSSTQVFGKSSATDIENYQPDENMLKVSELAKKIARDFLKIEISVAFFTSRQVSYCATFGNRTLNFNVTKLGKQFFVNNLDTLSLLIHEISHHKGMHTEESYQKCITNMGEFLVKKALKEPEYFGGQA
jgi:hypothetical protein